MSNPKSDMMKSMIKLEQYPISVKFAIVGFVLGDKITEDGSRGMGIIMSLHDSKDEAESKLLNMMNETGMKSLHIKQTRCWFDLTTSNNFHRTKILYEKKNGQLDLELFRKEEEMRKEEKKQEEIREQIAVDDKLSMKPGTVQYYTRQWYLSLVNRERIKEAKESIERYEKKLEESIKEIRKEYQNNPQLEEEWLGILEKKLKDRKEEDIFEQIKMMHTKTKNEILGDEIRKEN